MRSTVTRRHFVTAIGQTTFRVSFAISWADQDITWTVWLAIRCLLPCVAACIWRLAPPFIGRILGITIHYYAADVLTIRINWRQPIKPQTVDRCHPDSPKIHPLQHMHYCLLDCWGWHSFLIIDWMWHTGSPQPDLANSGSFWRSI
jgi:hypothetical protein